jgi:hypothetical protein
LEVFENHPGMFLDRETIANRDRLHLGTSFDTFLRTLGRHTRRNFRYYRRRAKLNGWRFIENLSPNEIMVALEQLATHQRTSHYRVSRLTRFAEAVKRMHVPCFMGLQALDGEWLSLIAGWHSGNRACVLFQLNRAGAQYDAASLSIALRSQYLERLIERGVEEVKFIGGCGGTLRRYCELEQYELLTLRRAGWRPGFFLSEERCRQAAAMWVRTIFGGQE